MDQSGLNSHFRSFFKTMSNDFRAANITQLVYKRLDPKVSVLDMGCGSCVLTRLLLGKNFNVTSTDASLEMLDMAREFLSEENLPTNNLHHLDAIDCYDKFGAAFEQIVCLDVIEHIKDDKSALEAMYGLLKPNGKILLSVPAISKLYGPKDIKVGHYRRYDRDVLINLFETTGFQIKTIRYWNFLGVPITWLALKAFNKAVDESVRHTNRSPIKSLLNAVLNFWFRYIENSIPAPIGLTLFIEAVKPINDDTK
jgi:2-polyprenyl-3-methyl-5-hydroxy-6-metoxy-1,4-benzoquinol methylase